MQGIGNCEYNHELTPVQKKVGKAKKNKKNKKQKQKNSFISNALIIFYKIAMMELSEKIATVHAATVYTRRLVFI